MKRRIFALGILIVCVIGPGLALSGCALGIEIDGVWSLSAGGITQTMSLSRNWMTATVTGLVSGTMMGTINRYDAASKHFEMTLTSVTGFLALGAAPGDILCTTYSISGNQLFMSSQKGGYPAVAMSGPYTKQ